MSLLKWNKDFALEQAAEDEELLQELIDIFKTSFASDIQIIQDGLRGGDYERVASAAHSIKGAAASLGIDGITEITRTIENEGKSGSLEETVRLLPRLEAMLEEILKL